MTTITQAIPIITITAEQIGPLGITLGAAGDPGGSCAPAGLAYIPLLDLGHFDERQICGWAHAYLDAHGYAESLPQPGAADLLADEELSEADEIAALLGAAGLPCQVWQTAATEGTARYIIEAEVCDA